MSKDTRPAKCLDSGAYYVQKTEASNYRRSPKNNKAQTNCDWQKIYDDLANDVSIRHYSLKTLKSDRAWVAKFQTFTKSENPDVLSREEIDQIVKSLRYPL